MGLTWSDRKCKQDKMLVVKAAIGDDIKDDVWLLWGLAKTQPKLKAAIKADNLTISKDVFDGHRWKIVWFHTITNESFNEVEEDGETILQWQHELNEITHKWITKIASIKDALVGSDDGEPSVEDPYDYLEPVEDSPPPKKKSTKKKISKVQRKPKHESSDESE